jgi:hypothetical protein
MLKMKFNVFLNKKILLKIVIFTVPSTSEFIRSIYFNNSQDHVSPWPSFSRLFFINSLEALYASFTNLFLFIQHVLGPLHVHSKSRKGCGAHSLINSAGTHMQPTPSNLSEIFLFLLNTSSSSKMSEMT